MEHEATTSKIGEDQLFYCMQRGLSEEDAVNMIVNGFCKEVLRELPMEFAVEAQNLLGVSPGGKRWLTRTPRRMEAHRCSSCKRRPRPKAGDAEILKGLVTRRCAPARCTP